MPPTLQDLKDHMREAGDVGYSDIQRGGRDGPVGVVEYSTQEDLDRAISKLDKSMFKCAACWGQGARAWARALAHTPCPRFCRSRNGDPSEIRVEEERGGADAPPSSSYSRGGYDDRGRRGYDDRGRGGYDDRGRGGYDDRGRGGYDDRGRGGYDDRRGDDRGRGGYDDRDRGRY